MTVPRNYQGRYLPTKYFLLSYRALSDGQRAIQLLEEHISADNYLMSDWKIHWIAASTLLRSAIDLFRQDAKSCLPDELRAGFSLEFEAIKDDKVAHAIFWDFLREERDTIIHHYDWRAYEAWLDDNGLVKEASRTLLTGRPDNAKSLLLMRKGKFVGQDSLDLLKEAAKWVEDRIASALARGGYDLEQARDMVTFAVPSSQSTGLLAPG